MGAITVDEPIERMLKATEVCKMLRIHRETLSEWLRMGLVGYKIGKVVRIPESELKKFLHEHQVGADPNFNPNELVDDDE
jgi:excisionase family DNA binding protein